MNKENLKIHCFNCKKEILKEDAITDKYNNHWCKLCAEEHLEKCDECKKFCEKDNMEHTEDGHQYCEDCITYCVHCNKPIRIQDAIDAIQEGEHDTWCQKCADKYLKQCDGCEQYYPKEEISEFQNNHYCSNCLEFALDVNKGA